MTYPGASTYPGPNTFPGASGTPWRPPNPQTGTGGDVFTVFAYDLNTNTKLAELPAGSLTFDSRLNDAGACQWTLPLDDPAVAKEAAPVVNLNGAPYTVYIDRDGVIVWGGIAWTNNYASSSRVLQVGAREHLSYFDSRTIAADYSQATYPGGIDPAQLMYKALTDAQNTALCGPGASIGLTVTGGTSKLPKIIPGYSKTQNVTVSQVVSDITAAATPGTGGVDLSITNSWGSGGIGGTPVKTAAIVTPRAGRSATQTGLIFDLGKPAIDYTWPSDATQAGTQIFAVGAGTGLTQPVGRAQSAQPVGGLGQYPRLDLVVNYAAVQSASQLAVLANGLARTFGQAVTTPTVTVPTSYPPAPLGSWLIGDDARLRTDPDPLFPSGLDQYWRIVQHTVTVPNSGVPTVTLTFNLPPIF